jgi:8-oxo-dGTP pyrophosphatase MutT (NUDIX family)
MDISSGGAVIPNLVSGAPCLSVDSRCVQHDTGDLALLHATTRPQAAAAPGGSAPGALDESTASPTCHAEPRLAHTGAGIFVLTERGWLAGLDSSNRWQDFGGSKSGDESPWHTATREFEEETGSDASYLVPLVSPYWMAKDDHDYVIHIAKLLPGAPPIRPTAEILTYGHFAGFANGFQDELVAPQIVHRRVLDPEFLILAASAHASLLKATSGRRSSRLLSSSAPTTRRKLKWDGGPRLADADASRSPAELTHDDCVIVEPVPPKVDHSRLSRRSATLRPPSDSSFEPDNGGSGPPNGTSCALQLAISDAVASAALAQRDDRGDARSCDDASGDTPQGT